MGHLHVRRSMSWQLAAEDKPDRRGGRPGPVGRRHRAAAQAPRSGLDPPPVCGRRSKDRIGAAFSDTTPFMVPAPCGRPGAARRGHEPRRPHRHPGSHQRRRRLYFRDRSPHALRSATTFYRPGRRARDVCVARCSCASPTATCVISRKPALGNGRRWPIGGELRRYPFGHYAMYVGRRGSIAWCGDQTAFLCRAAGQRGARLMTALLINFVRRGEPALGRDPRPSSGLRWGSCCWLAFTVHRVRGGGTSVKVWSGSKISQYPVRGELRSPRTLLLDGPVGWLVVLGTCGAGPPSPCPLIVLVPRRGCRSSWSWSLSPDAYG